MAKRIDDLLVSTETCLRQSFWHLDFEPSWWGSKEFLEAGVRHGLLTDHEDFAREARTYVLNLAADKEVRITGSGNQYDGLISIAHLAEIIVCAIRKEKEGPWKAAPPIDMGNGYTWDSGAFLDPTETHLRRISFVSDWNDDRHYSVCRSWANAGTAAAYGCDLTLLAVIVGAFREGRYRSPWTMAYRHPKNRLPRFRKKHDIESGFKETWLKFWREDSSDLTTKQWLEAMLSDGVLKDLLIRVDIPCPSDEQRQHILNLAKIKLDRLKSTTELPEQNLSTCDWPTPCIFRKCCHNGEPPSGRYGFVKIEH